MLCIIRFIEPRRSVNHLKYIKWILISLLVFLPFFTSLFTSNGEHIRFATYIMIHLSLVIASLYFIYLGFQFFYFVLFQAKDGNGMTKKEMKSAKQTIVTLGFLLIGIGLSFSVFLVKPNEFVDDSTLYLKNDLQIKQNVHIIDKTTPSHSAGIISIYKDAEGNEYMGSLFSAKELDDIIYEGGFYDLSLLPNKQFIINARKTEFKE